MVQEWHPKTEEGHPFIWKKKVAKGYISNPL